MDQYVVIVVTGVVTVVTLFIKSHYDRKAVLDAAKALALKTEAEARAIAAKAETDARELAAKVEAESRAVAAKVVSAADKAAAAVAEVKVVVNSVDQIREMVDGQRTAMLAKLDSQAQEIRSQTAKIGDLEKVIIVQREAAANLKHSEDRKQPKETEHA